MEPSEPLSGVIGTQHDPLGFNYEFGKKWIYPTNLPVRKYQKDIVQESLFRNTMVCLPTGLGKTFIAAVVMYNYYRWYPSGKIIFMATTKPLVKQQVDACYKIVAIPKESTAELTGSVLKQNRTSIWRDKRVFFLTPQVLRNDLDTIPDLGSKIKCIVIDEAHRARGNHAYCEVIKKLHELNTEFRVLALTATPASNVLDVINVCNQLLISHLEVRTEDSSDVLLYSHKKSIETIVIKLDGMLSEVVNDYQLILDKYVRILVENKVIHSNFSSLHKGRLFYLSKEYQEKNSHNRSTEKYKLITKVFAICTILYHGLDLLLRHGLRSFLRYYEENINKPLLIGCSVEIQELMSKIIEYIGPPLICNKLPDGSHIKLPENCKFGHPKFYKLKDILKAHFSSHDVNSKVIIFCEYKDTVFEAYASLLQEKNIKAKMFMGQSSITQKQQVDIIESFRHGTFNTLISTCIGEEGIDVGFVDMVICFDISNKSSVRFIQRIGRTGRDRNGRVVILVAEGREQQVLKECLQEKHHLCNMLMDSKNIDCRLYKGDPRMIPESVQPECQELFIASKGVSKLTNFFTTAAPSPEESTPTKAGTSKGNISLLSSLSLPSPNSINQFNIDLTNFIPSDDNNSGVDCFKFNKHFNIQRTVNSIFIPTSSKTEILIAGMKHIEYGRFGLEDLFLKSTDVVVPGSTKTSARVTKKKQADIRNMFQKCSQSQKIDSDKVYKEDEVLETLIEAKIGYILSASDDCKVCDKFENDLIIERELVPIGHLNLKLDLNFDITTLTNLQRKLNKITLKSCLNENLAELNDDDTFNNLLNEYTKKLVNSSAVKSVENIVDCNKSDSNSKTVTIATVFEKSPDNLVNNIISLQNNTSPDLFGDDDAFPVFSPLEASEINETIQNATSFKDVDLPDFIEPSPSPAVKRKASQSLITTMRSKKRTKLNFTDIVDVPYITKLASISSISTVKTPTMKLLKKNILASDIFDASYMSKLNNCKDTSLTLSELRGKESNLEREGINNLLDKTHKNTSEADNIDKGVNFCLKGPDSITDRTKRLSISTKDKALCNSEDNILSNVHNISRNNMKTLDISRRVYEKKITGSDLFDMNDFQSSKVKGDDIALYSSQASNTDSFTSRSPRKTRIKASDLFDFPCPKITKKSESAASSPDISAYNSFIVPSTPPHAVVESVRSSKIITEDIFDESTFKPAAIKSKVNLRLLKSPNNSIKTLASVEPNRLQSTDSKSVSSTSSLSSIEVPVSSLSKTRKTTQITKSRKGLKRGCAFIDSEVEVSSDELPSEDELVNSQDDMYDASFVDDGDDSIAPCSQTQAMYLQSVKSPVMFRKPLRRPAARHIDDTVMHQTMELTYAKDSFCVADDDVVRISEESLDELEKAELLLKKKRKKKRSCTEDESFAVGYRKKICRIESDSE